MVGVGLRVFKSTEVASCIVRIDLSQGKFCEIFTTAEHAMEILGGTTVIPTRMVTIFDRNGRMLTPRDLADRPDLR